VKRETIQLHLEVLKDLAIYLGMAACTTGLGAIGVLLVQDLAKAVAPLSGIRLHYWCPPPSTRCWSDSA